MCPILTLSDWCHFSTRDYCNSFSCYPKAFFFSLIRFVSQLLNVPGIFFIFADVIVLAFAHDFQSVFMKWLLLLTLAISVPAGKHIRLSLFIIAKIQICNCRQWKHAAQIFLFKGHLANLACMRHRNKHTQEDSSVDFLILVPYLMFYRLFLQFAFVATGQRSDFENVLSI